MKKSRYTDSQIINILKQAEAGAAITMLCCEHGMSKTTFYKWRAKYSGINTSLIMRIKELEEENCRLKKMYADACLHFEIIRDNAAKKKVRVNGGLY